MKLINSTLRLTLTIKLSVTFKSWRCFKIATLQLLFTCSKSVMETPEKCVLSLFNVNTKDTKTTYSDVFIINFEQFNFEHIDPLFPLLTLNK